MVVGLDDGPEAAWGPFVLACLDPTRFRRVGAVLSHAESGGYRSELADSVRKVAPPEPDPRAFAASIVALVAEERAAAVIAGSPRATKALSSAAKAVRAAGAAAIVASPERLARLTTRRLAQACRRKGLPRVRTIALPARVSYERLPRDLRYPVTLALEGGRSARASDPAQILAIAHGHSGGALVVDRDLSRTFEAAVVSDAAGRVQACAAVRVIASDSNGRTWMAVTVDDPALFAAARKAAAAIGGAGPFVISFEGGVRYRAAEIRPGFPTWVEAAHAAGVPLVHAALPPALRPPRPRGKPKAGILFSQTAEDLPIDLLQPVRLARAGEC